MLQLLAEENNMIVTMASPHQIQSMLKGKAPGRVAEALAELYSWLGSFAWSAPARSPWEEPPLLGRFHLVW